MQESNFFVKLGDQVLYLGADGVHLRSRTFVLA
jgi:hypothetical protein